MTSLYCFSQWSESTLWIISSLNFPLGARINCFTVVRAVRRLTSQRSWRRDRFEHGIESPSAEPSRMSAYHCDLSVSQVNWWSAIGAGTAPSQSEISRASHVPDKPTFELEEPTARFGRKYPSFLELV